KGHPMTENEEKYYKEHGSMKGYERSMTRREAGGEDTERHRSTRSTKRAAGGKVSVHDKLVSEGEKMGYAYGGQVKNTSAEFVQTRSKQDTMDHANFPVVNEASQRDKESGPRKERRPRFNYGGKVRQVRAAPEKRRKASGNGMPKGVKARGGLAAYAGGGAIEILGKGGARMTADSIVSRANMLRSTLDEATEALRPSTTRTTTPPKTARALSFDDPVFRAGLTPPAPEKATSKPAQIYESVGEAGERSFSQFGRAGTEMNVGGPVTAAKGGKNWIVNYTVTLENGTTHDQSRKFRVRADAYELGLLTHCIGAGEFAAIRTAMCEADPIDPVLDARHVDPGPSALLAMRETIDRYFSPGSVEDIFGSLESATGPHAEWAREVARVMRKHSPLSLKVAYRQMRRSGSPSLEEALELEGRIARHFLTGEELYEGIRALLIDKDKAPKWPSASLEDVGAEMVEAYFAPAGEGAFKPVNPFA
ncbi:MAG: enoyl-CoA hydratase/isomerase family protein, partial [Proteobacteria bacterium]|nr:enoyl-CoA hydratase/isomerase family protein [Pseudomonadota bacterium]